MCRRSISEGVTRAAAIPISRWSSGAPERPVSTASSASAPTRRRRLKQSPWRAVCATEAARCTHGLPSVCTRTRRPPAWTAWLHCSARECAVGDGVVVAVGECGLDYYYEHSPRAEQRAAFAAQIALAHARDLALVIHARDAWDDLFDVLTAEGVPERTILHCFTGGPEELDRCLRAGMFVSFSGIITFKSASDIREAASALPARPLVGGNRQSVPGAGAPSGASQRTIAVALGRGDGGQREGLCRGRDRRRARPRQPPPPLPFRPESRLLGIRTP